MAKELKAEMLGLSNVINDPSGISGGRVCMNGNQLKQTPDPDHPDPLQFPTGNEMEYGKYLFNDRSDIDGVVIANIQRRGMGMPDTLERVLFIKTIGGKKEKIAIHEIKRRHKHHETFVSELKMTEEGERIVRSYGPVVSKGLNYNQPNSYINGEWAISTSLPTAIMSDHSLIEDSYRISDWAADKHMSWGVKDYIMVIKPGQTLANLWGTVDNPRYLPRIGEKIKRSGKVIGVCDLSIDDLALELSDYYLHDPVAFYTNIHHNDGDATGLERATVVDVEVTRNDSKGLDGPNPNFNIPDLVQHELDAHASKYREFYSKVLIEHMKLAVEYNGEEKIPYTNKARRIVYEAIAKSPQTLFDKTLVPKYRPSIDRPNVARVYAYDRIETYRVKITVRYPIPLTVSGKISDFSGTKGIVSNISPVADMPVDEDGNIVHVMRCCGAQLRRSTYLPVYIIFMSHTAREVMRSIKEVYAHGGIEEAWPLMIDLTATFNPEWAEVVEMTHESTKQREELYKEVCDTRLRVLIPNDYDLSFYEICGLLKDKYGIKKKRLLLTLKDGSKEWTVNKFYVGNIQTIRLDKHGREFSSISSARFDPFGTIAKTTADETTFRPAPTKANTIISESEDRLLKNHGDSSLVDEIKDRSNNPIVADHETINVLRHPTPQNMEAAVNRQLYPLGHSRPMEILQHCHRVAGIELQKVKKNG